MAKFSINEYVITITRTLAQGALDLKSIDELHIVSFEDHFELADVVWQDMLSYEGIYGRIFCGDPRIVEADDNVCESLGINGSRQSCDGGSFIASGIAEQFGILIPECRLLSFWSEFATYEHYDAERYALTDHGNCKGGWPLQEDSRMDEFFHLIAMIKLAFEIQKRNPKARAFVLIYHAIKDGKVVETKVYHLKFTE